jgi:hypothetical protein
MNSSVGLASSPVKLGILLVFLNFLLEIPYVYGQKHEPIIPEKPAGLLRFLPGPPAGWTMTDSSAKSFFISWICSQATREFQHPAPVEPGSPPPPPFITRIRLMDTGYYPSLNGDFENFKVGKYSNAESIVISGMPARKITISPTRERLRVSVRGRFIVEVETDNQRPNSGQAWLQYLDFRRVSAIPDSGASQLPKPIIIENVDELQPARNSSSQVYWGGPSNTAGTEPR